MIMNEKNSNLCLTTYERKFMGLIELMKTRKQFSSLKMEYSFWNEFIRKILISQQIYQCFDVNQLCLIDHHNF